MQAKGITASGSEDQTLSMKQAGRIIVDFNTIVRAAALQIEQESKHFVDDVAKAWADNNAVDFMKKYKSSMEGFVQEMQENANIFGQQVKDIADGYAIKGNMPTRLSYDPLSLGVNIVVDAVKEFFSDSQNSDDFGFKNTAVNATKVMEAWKVLSRNLDKIARDTVDQLQSINAFGDQRVKSNLVSSAGKVIDIARQHIITSETLVETYVGKTAADYIKVGNAASAASTVTIGE